MLPVIPARRFFSRHRGLHAGGLLARSMVRMLRTLRIDFKAHLLESPPERRVVHGLKRLAKYLLAGVFHFLGLTGWLLRRLLVSRRSAVILGYHGIVETPADLFSAGHDISHVAAQLRFLKRHLRPVPLGEIAEAVSRGEAPAAGAFAVTFDDGLQNNVLFAIPLLRELSLPATFFVPSDFVDSSIDLWVTSLMELIRHWPEPILPAEPGQWPDLSVADEEGRYAAFIRIRESLKLNEEGRQKILDRLAVRIGGYRRPPEGERVVGKEMLLRMSQPDLTVGAHSRSHSILSRLDPARAAEEISGSRRDLEAILGRKVLDFAYPNGRFADLDERVCRLVAEAGYRCAVTTEPGTVRQGDDRLALRRCVPDNVPAFLAAFDLLVRTWTDCYRPADLAKPVGRRTSRAGNVSVWTAP